MADLSPLQAGILVGTAAVVLFGAILAAKMVPGGIGISSFLAMPTILMSGSVAVLAWTNAGPRKPLLLARFGLSVLIGVANSYGVYFATEDGSHGVSPGVALLLILIVPFIAAPMIGWWQIRRFARKHGMLAVMPT